MKNRYLYSLCLILVLGWGVLLFPLIEHFGGGGPPGEIYQGKRVTYTGLVDKLEPKSYGEYYIYLISAASYSEADGSDSAATNPPKGIICTTKSKEVFDKLKCGDIVSASGTFELIKEATNPGEFDGRSYYLSLGIEGRIKNASIELIGTPLTLQTYLYDIKTLVKQKIAVIFPEKEAGIITAVIPGDKEGLPKEVKEKYTEAGIVHILAISSLHVTLIGMGVYRALRKLRMSQKYAAGLAIPVMVLYLEAIDGGVSARRSVFMFVIHMIGVIIGRTYDVRTALALSALSAVISEPSIVLNSGFWLSYGCVLAVTGFDIKAGKRAIRIFEPGIRIFLGTLPIILWFYYEVSFWGIILNVLAIPLISACVATGFVSLFIPLSLKPLITLVSKLVQVCLFLIEKLCDVTGLTGVGSVIIGKPSVILVILYYLLLFFFINSPEIPAFDRFSLKKKGIAFALGASLILLFSGNRSMKVTFLDVGQGDGIAVLDGKDAFLIDGGSSSKTNVGEYVILPYLKHEGIRKVKGVFLSHPDADHINGTLEILEKGEIGIDSIYLSECLIPDWIEKHPEIFEICERRNIMVYGIHAGNRIRDGDLNFTCIFPFKGERVSDTNDGSEVLLLEACGNSFLFAGDLGAAKEEKAVKLLKNSPGFSGVDYLKVGHHGSDTSSSGKFLDIVNPKYALISVGKNSYGHPGEDTLEKLTERGIPFLRTDTYGAVEIFLKNNFKKELMKGK